jgi:Ca2+-binding RTX toxin-like protein
MLSTHGAFAFSDLDLTDAHTVSVTNVAVSGAPAGFVLPPGGLGIFAPTITENTGDADPVGHLSWSFTVDNAALATLNFGDHIQQVYTVRIDDGNGGVATQNVTLTLVGITDQPTLTVQVLTPNGMFVPGEDPIEEMGAGAVQPGGTSAQFTITNVAAHRKFVFDGYGFTFDASHAPTGGLITAIHEFTNDAVPVPLANFSGVGVGAQAWYEAIVEVALGGPDPKFQALTSGWAFNFIGNVGPDNFNGGDQNDVVTGGDGDDFLLGGGGTDILTGGSGNDTLGGGAGIDQLNGGNGLDLAIYFSSTDSEVNAIGPISVQLAVGVVTTFTDASHTVVDSIDTLRSIERIRGTNFSDSFDATSFNSTSINAGSIGVGAAADGSLNEFEGLGGDDFITGNGDTRVSYLHATSGVTVTFTAFGVGTATGDASVGTDHFLGGVNRVRGSDFVDHFIGSNNGPNTNEHFEGRGGNDIINGGGGFDTAVYGNEGALINVQLAAGVVTGGVDTGTDTLLSVEAISGTSFSDILNASGFMTVPTGLLPNAGSAGADGSGNAFNRLEGRGGNDIITGNNNTQIAFDNATDGVTVTFTGAGTGNSHGTAAGDVSDVGTDTFTGVNSVRGSGFDDIIIASDPGNDLFDGRGGIDRAIYTGATGPLLITMLTGTSTISGAGVGADTLQSVESIQGSAFGDTYVATGYNGASAFGSVFPTFNEFEGMGGDDNITGGGGTVVSYLHATAAVTVDLNFPTVPGSTGIAHATAADAGIGTDTFFGGTQVVRGSAFGDTLSGSANFTEVFDGGAGNDFIDGRGGFDRVLYDFRHHDDDVTGGITINLAAGTVVGDASVGTDTLRSIEAARGTHFDDIYDATGFTTTNDNGPNFGSAGSDRDGNAFNEFDGLGGNDTIIGNGNTRVSYINATAGVTIDLAFGTATGDDSVGTDTLSGVNSIIGSGFADTLYGSYNVPLTSEIFDGGAGNDTLVGRGGFDLAVYNADQGTVSGIVVDMASGIVVGDASIGTDTLGSIESIRGTNFADTYVANGFIGASADIGLGTTFNEFEGMGGDDNIIGNGDTRLTYQNASAAVTIDLVGGTAHGTAPGDAANVGTDTFSGVNRVIGSNFNDAIAGDSNNNVLEGGPGNDTMDGGAGNDTASYVHAPGGVTVDLNNSGPQNTGQAGTDTLTNLENLLGSDFNDTLTGKGNSTLEGRGGADQIIGHSGGADVASYEHASTGVTVSLTNNSAVGTGDAAGDTFTFINNVRGSSFGDQITGNANANVLDGGLGGNDQLIGLSGADKFVFHGGHLTITDFNQGNGTFSAAEGDLIDIRTLNGSTPISDAALNALIAASPGSELNLGNENIIDLPGVDVHLNLSAANFIHS